MTFVMYEGVICAGPNKGKMLTQSVSSFSYTEFQQPLPLEMTASELKAVAVERVTMMLFSIGVVRETKVIGYTEQELSRTYKGIWVPVTWDEQRCMSFLINCACSFLQRDIAYVDEEHRKAIRGGLGT